MYLFTAIILFIFSIACFQDNIGLRTQKKHKRVNMLVALSCLWLVLHDGLRWQVGSDWQPYYEYFYSPEEYLGFEPAYRYANIFIRSLTDNYTWFLLFVAVCFHVPIIKRIKQYSINPFVSITIFYCIMVGMMGMNRQDFSLSLSVFSLPFIINRNWKAFFIIIAVAFCFHRTAVFFIPAYFLYNKKIPIRLIAILMLIAVCIYYSGIINRIPLVQYAALLGGDFEYKIEAAMMDDGRSFSAITGVLKRLILVFAFYKFLHNKFDKNPSILLFFNLYIVGVFMYLFTNGTYLQTIASRGALYYNIYECILVPFLLYSLPMSLKSKRLVWFVVFIYYCYMMYRGMDSYLPIAGEIFRPYKSVLF